MTLMAGNFRSADTDGDGYYENDARCIWIIEKSAPANAVQILVTSIDIELNDDCADDFMQVRLLNLFQLFMTIITCSFSACTLCKALLQTMWTRLDCSPGL